MNGIDRGDTVKEKTIEMKDAAKDITLNKHRK